MIVANDEYIAITRGDCGIIQVAIDMGDDGEYEITAEDTIELTVREKPTSESPVILHKVSAAENVLITAALKENPVFTGSFSQNRKVSSKVGFYSHTEGYDTTASEFYSHAEGYDTTASSTCSHAEGASTTASGVYSHAEGFHTKASGSYSHVQGKYNIDDTDGKYAHIVGNGTIDTARSNAHTLDWEGNAWYAGTVEGTAMIVKSSTPDSTKKFKITVDDTGTISATEVT